MKVHTAKILLLALLAAFSAADAVAGETPRPNMAACPWTKFYDQPSWAPRDYWKDRLERKRKEIAASNGEYDLVFVGDSITHNWEGWPEEQWAEIVSRPGVKAALTMGNDPGRAALEKLKRDYSILNLGVGGDATGNVLWRLRYGGQLEGYRAKCFMLMIGTNNGEENPADVAEGVRAILDEIARRQPQAVTLLLPIFPRGEKPDHPRRRRNEAVNELIARFADGKRVVWVDFNRRLVDASGVMSREMMSDFLHPTPAGYAIWAEEMAPYFRKYAAHGGAGGFWCYRPCECEAWLLRRSRAEADAGVLHFSYPGSFLTLEREPECFFSEKPVDGYASIPGRPDCPPHRREFPETRMPLVRNGNLCDRGTIDIGYVRAKAPTEPRLFVGESLAEVRSSDTNGFEQSTRMVEESPGRWRSVVPLALRYFRFEAPVEDAAFDSQVDWSARPQPFVCGDPRLCRMREVGVETLRRCKRHFILDGIKRDRLPWAADLVIGILAEARSFRDAETIRRTLAVLGSGDPSQTQVNGILPFSLWWVIAHDLFQRHFGDEAFLRLHYPRICARMDELAGHEDARGFVVRNLGRDFMDWTDDKGGSLKSEITRQVIYFGALRSAARLAGRVGDTAREAAWAARAERLRAAVLVAGMDGTRHARMMAIVFGLVGGETAKEYARAIAADTMPPTVTPYMATFEVLALAKCGEAAAARKKFESVWGRMVDAGVDTYWEGWDERMKGDAAYVFYSRPFGKSLCHAWASGPVFLVPILFANDGEGGGDVVREIIE